MKTLCGLIALTACLALVACQTGVGERAPDFTLTDTDGRAHALSDYDGEVRVLDFWATWCAPCRVVSPHMQAIHERYADEPVKVLAIHYDGSGDPAAYGRKHGLTYTSLVDGHDVAEAYGVSKIPTIIVVDRAGRVVHRQTGFGAGDERTIDQIVQAALTEGVASGS